jgi:hypothetical protein
MGVLSPVVALHPSGHARSSQDGTAGPADRPRQPATASRRRANAYRIVQEALTNTLNHAGAARTTALWSCGSATTATGAAHIGVGRYARRRPPVTSQGPEVLDNLTDREFPVLNLRERLTGPGTI